ncbi:hypothetical protein PFDG_05021 [Plasmodium falciparum Dd2]|uniref:Uncharacterized protein n=1 Tax=Plasmodium falciparum (isolate Dd2) TaxID=57267 RepID=A0A0L7M9F1_PLAF4|nr:hypothetical protein PFDG_05021 [Plasmodium falciparum Dd2]
MLLFAFLFNALLLSQNVNCRNNNYNIRFTQKITQQTSTKSRHLAEIERPKIHIIIMIQNSRIIDKLNESIKIPKNSYPYDNYKI